MLWATATLAGCGGVVGTTTATFPSCPVPVLLSRIDRVGGKAPTPSLPTGTLDHFALRAADTKSADSQREYRYAYTEVNLATGQERDVYDSFFRVIADERKRMSGAFTERVHQLAPTLEDVRASDIVIDRVRITADFTVVGLPDSGSANLSHKVWRR
jgi:hypothetical protein